MRTTQTLTNTHRAISCISTLLPSARHRDRWRLTGWKKLWRWITKRKKMKHQKIKEFAVKMLREQEKPLPAGIIAGEFNRRHNKRWSVSPGEVAITLRAYPDVFFKVKQRGGHPLLWGLKEWQDSMLDQDDT